jgi:hypothetical protein
MLFSPADLSVLNYLIVNWNVFQGFTLFFYLALNSGDNTDIYGWGRAGDVSLTIKGEFKFGGRS